MGAGASAKSALKECSQTDLADMLREVPEESRARLKEALARCEAKAAPAVGSAAAADSGAAVAVAGENEDGVDTELQLELSKQEVLFLKCLRKRAERDQKRKLEKEARKAAAKAQKDKAMELAFENEVDQLLSLFEEGVEPECTDEHGTTLLSEAAGGGAQDVCEVLLGEGCDPNSLGRYHRTPLWRAAYAGNAALIRILLRSGADPREPDEQGAKPMDVASNPESKELLLCWDTTATERIQQANQAFRRQNAKAKEKEEKAKVKRQNVELNEAIEEATRKAQIARSELAKAKKLLQDYRQQKVNYAEMGEADRIAELEPLLEGTEVKMKMFEASVQEWEWKISRAKLKLSDFNQQLKEKADKAAGKKFGFTLETTMESLEELDEILPHLDSELSVSSEYARDGGFELKVGDSMLKDGPFSHLRKSEFTKKMLESYGREPPVEAEEGAEKEEKEEKEAEEAEAPFPLVLRFARGFDRTIPIKSVADVLLKDVGGLRAADGRWPFVIDPSGRTSTFVQYTGATVFHMAELQDMDPLRLRRALLKNLMNGGAVLIDLGDFDFALDVVEEPFNKVEKGLFRKLSDRTVLFSYLLPRRFRSLITPELKQEFFESMFLDDAIQKFVLGFVTSMRDPDFDFAKQFYTVYVKGEQGEEEAKDGA